MREFVAVAKGQCDQPWAIRGLATLLAENQLLRPGADLTSATGTCIEDPRPRLARLNAVHGALRRGEWVYVERAARDLSKLYLARFFFTPEEVVARIRAKLRLSAGVPAAPVEFHAADLPEYEASILASLCADNQIYWVSSECGSALNDLVEYPLTTAVVVIKPPGSDLEFEIKRAGTRGLRLLNVIARKNGKDAPTSHRLFGGSLGWLAQREAASANLFSKIYRLVHGTSAPFSHTIQNSAVTTVPGENGEVHLLDYLTSAGTFGEGFEEMRDAMRVCSSVFPSDTGVPRASYQGAGGETLQFIGQSLPTQAIICGSSSYRIDRVALYLSPSGPAEYFAGHEPAAEELQWFADSVLQEILGGFEPPAVPFRTFVDYVAEVFALPSNRARADASYVSVLRQLGACWGTLLALHGYTDGESFVQRNVGLKSVWTEAAWHVRAISMDHDDLTFAGSRYTYAWPSREVPGMMRDEVHLLGGPLSGETIPGDVGALANIYRVNGSARSEGVAELQEALCNAYDRMQSAVDNNPDVQSLLYPEFVERHCDLDWVAGRSLRTETWMSEAADYLRGKAYGSEAAAELIQAVSQFRPFFERMAFLYGR